ncbi:MAG TPA: hypothetical protein VJU14_03440 [Solirubrobacterales bacterium]|nr:hypothetical protein [Solirubrobacterales bacterium]
MIRKLKIMIAALVAALALGAAATATASAAYFHSEVVPTKISGVSTSAHVFSNATVNVTCQQASFQGVMTALTHEELTLVPEYSGCDMKVTGGVTTLGATVNLNGCDYRIFSYGRHEIACPPGKAMEFSIAGCTVTVVPQTDTVANTYTNKEKHIDVGFGPELLLKTSGFLCGTTQGNGSYAGTATLSGKAWNGMPVKIWHE